MSAVSTNLFAKKASNLSDLASAATARTNLGLGSLATQSGTFSGTSSGTNTGDQDLSNLVVGPSSVTDGHVVLFDGATGKLVKTSGLTLSGTNTGDQTNVSGYSEALKSATTTVVVSAAAAPTSGQVLTATSDTAASWQTPASGSADPISLIHSYVS